MRPKSPNPPTTDDLFRNRLSNILDQRHALLRLTGLIDWSRFEQEWDLDEIGARSADERLRKAL